MTILRFIDFLSKIPPSLLNAFYSKPLRYIILFCYDEQKNLYSSYVNATTSKEKSAIGEFIYFFILSHNMCCRNC